MISSEALLNLEKLCQCDRLYQKFCSHIIDSDFGEGVLTICGKWQYICIDARPKPNSLIKPIAIFTLILHECQPGAESNTF